MIRFLSVVLIVLVICFIGVIWWYYNKSLQPIKQPNLYNRHFSSPQPSRLPQVPDTFHINSPTPNRPVSTKSATISASH